MNTKIFYLSTLLILLSHLVSAQDVKYKLEENVHYYSEEMNNSDDYINKQCVLDIYYPENKKNFSTVIWFHGGGLTGGSKFIPERLKNQGLAVVSVEYRMYPKIKCPVYIEDAAAAVSWVFKNISKYGGDSTLIFISGHSAGGYLALMLGLDKKWLAANDVDADNIAGLIPFSGHTITHFTVREERGIPGTQPVVDSLAPLYYVRADAPPLLLITGDRDKEMLGRYEENAYLWRMMQIVGHPSTELYELEGYGHNMTEAGYPLLLNEVHRIEKKKSE